MRRRWSRGRGGAEPEAAASRRTMDLVDDARGLVAAAAPSGRTPRLSLAEALAAFDERLLEALGSIHGWPSERAASAARAAIEESRRRAEELRLGDPPDSYEALYGRLADVMEPLDGVDGAAAAGAAST